MAARDTLNSRRAALGAIAAAAALAGALPARAAQKIRVGIRGGIGEELWAEVAQIAKGRGLDLQLVVLGGQVSPNEALNNGDLEANAFQHVPFLRDQIQQRGYKIVSVGNTLIAPIAFYSKTYKSLEALPAGARVGIPNDPSNQTRALVILRDHGLIALRDGFDPYTQTAGLADVKANPRRLQLVASASAVLARAVQDLDAAAVINTFAYQAGLLATRDGIAIEKKENNPYVNIIAVRERDKDAPWVRPLVESFQNERIRRFIETKYEGTLIPAF
ncbi:MetQ/NlpA family ABC transporter substrate-binding protein [Xylophilus sp.]|uniref:MetQ/NlpA family ABC transporter substrate-binding protein n=1 Tax=Xylophilus sp. TaxID=2653893 RepID=UPI0013BB86A5|nr:MetQ/NlpA family lipoprotein [Xylophilus sp.]KAF1042618.1 MAG: D-methionine-binding lipoprotein MetQ [Xylophilus sp.]